MRIGQGYDSHRMVEGRPLILGGVRIPYEKGLYGHSDADALIHAIIDAIFGAAAAGDIGTHFPDSDPAYKGADSMMLLAKAGEEVGKKYRVSNIDATVIIEKPKMAPHIPGMQKNIASALSIAEDRVSIKAKTNEGMDAVGKGDAVVCFAVCLLEEK